MVADDLEETEKWELLAILQKLHLFHQPVFLANKNNAWQDLENDFEKITNERQSIS
jgi:hypothetical protein